jgi:cytochrome c-type biogenesis protein
MADKEVAQSLAIALVGLVQRLPASGNFQKVSLWFRKLAGVAIGLFWIYLIIKPFIDGRA